MLETKPIEIIKGAILLERNGMSFYRSVAQQTKFPVVREVFETMAQEEQTHVSILTQQYQKIVKDGTLQEIPYTANPESISVSVLTQELANNIEQAGYEAAAISAAMGLEEKAVQYYSAHAAAAVNETEKKLYSWLANWEKTHLKFLLDIDNEIKEMFWNDSQFWPI
ncbi:ferritin family protein [bacterium]|nr:ferritin family protein [bacterium]